jgi:hypothetical protein
MVNRQSFYLWPITCDSTAKWRELDAQLAEFAGQSDVQAFPRADSLRAS